MHGYIDFALRHYPRLYKHVSDVVHHIFAVNGNGIDLDNKGYIPDNYRSEELYDFPEPVPFTWMYPWSKYPEFRPFSELAGCRDVGFKETAQYFIDCVKLTPDDVENAKEWKDNIELVEQALLNTPTIEDEYPDIESGYATFLAKLPTATVTDSHSGLSESTPKSLTKRWFFDVQWSDCPEFVENEVRHLWVNNELGNDHYIYKAVLDKELFDRYPNIYYWLKYSGVAEGEKVLIHWWW